MRGRSIVGAVVLAVTLAGFSGSPASAAPPVDVSTHIMPTRFSPVEIGTWDASGSINDSGTFVRKGVDGTGSIPNPFSPEHPGAFREVFVLSGVQGTLTVREQAEPMRSTDRP